jgi:hypothetical protein
MKIALECPNCVRFTAPPETSSDEILERMHDEDTWFGLGEGETFEDMIFSSLAENGGIACPACGDHVMVSEETLGQLAMELLAQW